MIMAWKASNLSQEKGLTSTIMADILWSLHLCLSREITSELSSYILQEREYDFLYTKILQVIDPLIKLWYETTQKVGTISRREGSLPRKWEEEKQRELQLIKEIKRVGVSARFNDGPLDEVLKKCRESKVNTDQAIKVNDVSFKEIRSKLQNSLIFIRQS